MIYRTASRAEELMTVMTYWTYSVRAGDGGRARASQRLAIVMSETAWSERGFIEKLHKRREFDIAVVLRCGLESHVESWGGTKEKSFSWFSWAHGCFLGCVVRDKEVGQFTSRVLGGRSCGGGAELIWAACLVRRNTMLGLSYRVGSQQWRKGTEQLTRSVDFARTRFKEN